jgi:uncharacterized protein YciI
VWHLTLHRWTGDRPQDMELLESHLKWMRYQQVAGTIIAAGPTPDREMGIMVFGHMTRAELDEICRTDPFIAGGHREYEAIPWEVPHLLGIGGFDLTSVEAMLAAETRLDAAADISDRS